MWLNNDAACFRCQSRSVLGPVRAMRHRNRSPRMKSSDGASAGDGYGHGVNENAQPPPGACVPVFRSSIDHVPKFPGNKYV